MDRALSPDQIKRINDLRARRRTPDQIATSLGLSAGVIRDFFGLRPINRRLLSEQDKGDIRRSLLGGETRFSISRRYNVDHKVINYVCQDILAAADVKFVRGRLDPDDLREVKVPAWVPEHLIGLYRNVADKHGEEEAASTCRKLKNGRSVAQLRLPAVVSPAGC